MKRSPSMRREWIEMKSGDYITITVTESPSMRREWIEIYSTSVIDFTDVSPSMRREWIEIKYPAQPG